MKTVFIWGAGKMCEIVYHAIRKDECSIEGVLDSNIKLQGELWNGKMPIFSPDSLLNMNYDFIVISTQKWQLIEHECEELGIPDEKIVVFWRDNCDDRIIDNSIKRIAVLEWEVDKCKHRIENIPYELGIKKSPIVKSSEELLNDIIQSKKSLCRFGDGEFELMRGKERLWYQKVNIRLAERLKEVLASDLPHIIIAIPDIFGNLDRYKEKAADDMRKYLNGDTRQAIMQFLRTEQIFYNAYVSRPYYIYKNRHHAEKIFSLFKKIWENRNIVVVEGKHTRSGVGNDLFSNVRSIKRIICPAKNAYDHYDEIKEAVVCLTSRDDLVLVSLGPAATLLTYDIAKYGIQALDIGQLDNEYEWFLRNIDERSEIPGKVVAEISWCHNPEDIEDDEYSGQIIKRIG